LLAFLFAGAASRAGATVVSAFAALAVRTKIAADGSADVMNQRRSMACIPRK
jgi:hypothetical protein